MKARLVIDASVAAKWVVTEVDSDAAHALLDQELLVPDVLFGECANVLWKKVVRGELDASTADLATSALLAACVDVFPSIPLVPKALKLAILLRHPVYDCLYLALAAAEHAVLVTADRRLYLRCQQADAQSLGLRIHLLGEPSAAVPAVH